MSNTIVTISVQRYVVVGDIVNSITAYNEKGYKIGREQRVYQSKALTDSEVRASVNAEEETPINRETLGPAVGNKW